MSQGVKGADDAPIDGDKRRRFPAALLPVHAVVFVVSLLYALEFTSHPASAIS
jgi:hypothetical protein